MAWQPTLKVTPNELAYRAKHYHDIRTVKERQLICTCCGSTINIEAGNFHVHPVMGSLQCETCWDRYNDVEFASDQEGNKFCRLCGCSSDLHQCTILGCKFAFCRRCIKRNANLSLLEVDCKTWKCFLCAPKQFWEVRAVCAAVMDVLPKKIKKKINANSSPKWSKRPLPHIRQQIEHTHKLTKRLKKLCDDDDDDDDDDHHDGDKSSSERRPSFGFKTFEKEAPSKRKEDALQKKGLHKLYTMRSSEDSGDDDLVLEHDMLMTSKVQEKMSRSKRNRDNSSSEIEILGLSKNMSKRNRKHGNDSSTDADRQHQKSAEQVSYDSEGETSSGKEFETSKLSLTSSSRKRRRKKKRRQLETEQNISAEKCEEDYIFDKEDSISLKIHVIQILDEIKTAFESQVSKIKETLNESEISNVEEANHAMKKCTDTFQKLQSTIKKKQNNLNTFYTTWNESCKKRRIPRKRSHKDGKSNSTDSGKVSTQRKDKSVLSDDDEGSNKQIIQVSDCDVNEIFSENESPVPTKVGKHPTRGKVTETITDATDSDSKNEDNKDPEVTTCSSPVLGTTSKENRLENDNGPLDDELTIQGKDSSIVIEENCSDESEEIIKDSSDGTIKTSNKNSDKNQSVKQQKKNLNKTSGASTTLLNNPEELNDSLNDIFDSSSEFNNEANERTSAKENLETPNELDTPESLTEPEKRESTESCTNRKSIVESDVHSTKEKHREISSTATEHTKSKKSLSDNTQSKEKPDTSVDVTENTEEKRPSSSGKDELDPPEVTPTTNSAKEKAPKSANDVATGSGPTKNVLKGNKYKDFKLPASADKQQSSDSDEVDSSCSTVILTLSDEVLPDVPETVEKTSDILDTPNDNCPEEKKTPDEDKSDDEVEKHAKDALLGSNSDDSAPLADENSKEVTNEEGDRNDEDSDNIRTKKALLNSSNSESSSSHTESDINEPSVPTKTNSSHKKKLGLKRRHDVESDNSVGSRVKRRRLRLDKNKYYKKDEKLRMRCYVVLKRLKPRILRKYSRALKKSRQYQESKALKSLISLDGLEKKRIRKCINSDSSDSSDDHIPKLKPTKNLKNKKGKGTETEESLLDHLKKVENCESLEVIDEISSTQETPPRHNKTDVVTNAELMSEADRIAKDMLLNSDSDLEQDNDSDKSTAEKEERKKERAKKKSSKASKDDKNSDSDEEKNSKADKSSWKRDKLLTMKFSDSDSDVVQKKCKQFQEKQKEKGNKDEETSDNSGEDIKPTIKKNTKRRRRVMDSDSDVKLSDSESSANSNSDVQDEEEESDHSDKKKKTKSRRKRGGRKSSDSDSSIGEKRPKPKRKRIKTMDSDSDVETANSQGSPNKSGRKNIRKVLKDKQVAEDTKQAAKEEEERLKRIAERQRVYNEMYEMRLAGEEKVEKLVLDFDPETKKELIVAHVNLAKRLKPHQAQGIKFMFDACYETLERIKTSKGSGCILAHCMGLGKTLQVITLAHTLLTHEETKVKTVMVVCPLSTVLNWVNEFSTWLTGIDEEIEVYEMTKAKQNFERKYIVEQWQRTGGVLIIGYEMFRNLTGPRKNMRKGLKTAIMECLVDPGPDLVVCDEGHLLKNEETALSKSMKQIKTLRRIVLTGTPLQNNLIEYHCMVQFVKPNLLGTKKEFLNRFVNPITNGQFDNSTAYDVKLMKKRAHVLHKMLEGSVQRFDYSVLTPFLPPKQEYVIFVRLSDVQIKMYRFYLENFARRHTGVGGSLFADFQALQRIWTHPTVIKLSSEKIANDKKRLSSDSEGSLKDFIDDDTTSATDSESSDNSSKDSDIQSVHDPEEKTPRRGRSNPAALVVEDEPEKKVEEEWWSQFIQPEHFDDIRTSSKLVLLFEILKECEEIGDKVLVFSQSLYSLSLIEEFLGRIDNATQDGTCPETLGGHTGSWSLGLDYFRLDGQSSAENRSRWCKIFNRASNTRARLFLISTRAGGLGINLTAANRVIIFDASWNPSHDVQSIFRVYRFGQKKPCYVYRFLAAGTMEEKIYNRQVTKLSLSCRVVDEQQIGRHYSNNDLNELYKFEGYDDDVRLTLNVPKDRLLAEIFSKHKGLVENYHEHDSLLENKAEEELDEEERKQAWLEYEEEKKGRPVQTPMIAYQNSLQMQQYNMMRNLEQSAMNPQAALMQDYQNLQQLIRKDYPNATEEQQKKITTRALMEMYQYYDKQVMLKPTGPQMMPVRMMMPNTVVVNSLQQQPQQRQQQHQQNSEVSQLMQHLQPNAAQQMNFANQSVNKNLPGVPYTLAPQNTVVYRNVPTTSRTVVDNDIVEVPTSTSNVAPNTTVQPTVQTANKGKEE